MKNLARALFPEQDSNDGIASLNLPSFEHTLTPLARAFGHFIAGMEPFHQQEMGWLAALLSQQVSEQHSCLSVNDRRVKDIFAGKKPADILNILQASQSVCGPKEANKPLVLDGTNLYLQRYWQYESQLAARLLSFAARQTSHDMTLLKTLIDRLFVQTDKGADIDWQKVAVCMAARQALCVITGGPGTGKTTTVAKLIALLQGLATAGGGKALRIEMVAPTGKAAARLSESIMGARKQLPQDLAQYLPTESKTIHRLLGPIVHSPSFKANKGAPLHLDVLIIDEASMIDLALMSKLFEALPEDARVILLGDQEQLSSVETGNVLADLLPQGSLQYSAILIEQLEALCDTELAAYGLPESSLESHGATHALMDNRVQLVKSHRFHAKSGIGHLAKAILQQDVRSAQDLLLDDGVADLKWVTQNDTRAILKEVLPAYKAYFQAVREQDLALAFECLSKIQVLCATRGGPWGMSQLNHIIENELSAQGDISLGADFYLGRPIMVGQNDAKLRLSNGDIGIVMEREGTRGLRKVYFQKYLGEGKVEYSSVLPSQLPKHDTMYAMTVHKSQGSEYQKVIVALPWIEPGVSHPLLNKELLYTGLTRAKSSFTLFASSAALALCLQQKCSRHSGLLPRLQKLS